MLSARLTSVFLPLSVIVLWAFNAIVTKLSAGEIDPFSMAFYRWALAFTVLTPFVAKKCWKHRYTILRYWRELAVLGFLGTGLNQTFTYAAAPHTTATMMGILAALTPVFVAAAGSLFLDEELTWGVILGTILSLGGMVYLVSGGDISRIWQQGIGRGELFLLIANLSYTGYCLLLKLWELPLSRWISLYGQIFFSVLFLFPGYFLAESSSISWLGFWIILYAAIPNSVLAPFLWMLSITRVGMTTSAMYMNLLPLSSALLGVLFLNEQLENFHLIGGGLAILGVICTQKMTRPVFSN